MLNLVQLNKILSIWIIFRKRACIYQHFNHNRIIFVDVKQKFERAHI
jgi:hypothetical protein